MAYWLFKSEPGVWSWDMQKAKGKAGEEWTGVRNYQARNNLRDLVKKNDLVLFYHSSCKQIGIAGIMKVVKAAYPDPAQFDPHSKYYDVKSEPDNPRWYCVDVRLVEKFPQVVATKILKADPVAAELSIFKQGRLSIAPISAAQWQAVQRLRADGPV